MAREERRIPGSWKSSSGWVRITDDGHLQLELFDFSDEAGSSLGGDVAWLWTLDARHFPALFTRLPARTSQSNAALLDYLVQQHATVHKLRDWIRDLPLPLKEEFDSQA